MTSAVTGVAFEARLADVAAVADPRAGLFGPGSHMWRVQREAGVFLGAGAALLLQTAHPFVAQGVADHSRGLDDPLGRFYRTFRPVFAMVFGPRDDALAAARAVRAVHERIHGTLPDGRAYSASDEQALLWVHLTLWHTSIAVYRHLVGPLGDDDRDAYARETARFAALFGLPADAVPQTWSALDARFQDFVGSAEIAVGAAGQAIGSYFLGRTSPVGRVLPEWYRALTASLLPPALARTFGLREVTEEDAARLWRRLAAFYRNVPAPLRFVGPYQEAQRRIAGRDAGLWVTGLNRLWLGTPLTRRSVRPRT